MIVSTFTQQAANRATGLGKASTDSRLPIGPLAWAKPLMGMPAYAGVRACWAWRGAF